MRLAEYCRSEDAYLLLPAEHLGPRGPDAGLAACLRDECGWSHERLDLLRAAFSTYWSRGCRLVEESSTWPSPRVRNLGIAKDGVALRPYAQVLGIATWSLYESDFEPRDSHAEVVAYLLALGDWMAMTGEVTQAGVRSALWWQATGETERSAFCRAASRSRRPDAASLAAVADAIPWLLEIRHRRMHPPKRGLPCREVPGTGLLVPKAIEDRPQRLVDAFRATAIAAVDAYRSAWRRNGETAGLCAWLRSATPLVVVTDETGRPVWDPNAAAATEKLEAVLADADQVAVGAIEGDLRIVDEHSRRFLAALRNPADLALPDHELAESGYAYMYPRRHVVAYNLREPGMERLTGPALPYERSMLGARTLHEWGHLAAESGWVAQTIDDVEMAKRKRDLAVGLERAVEGCAARIRNLADDDLARIRGGRPTGDALAELLLQRVPDYRANLVARAFMSEHERVTYARHNIRTLRHEIPAKEIWRMLVRYLYEYQYALPALGLIDLGDPYGYFAGCTGFEAGFVERGILDAGAFRQLAALVARVCDGYRVDARRIRLPK